MTDELSKTHILSDAPARLLSAFFYKNIFIGIYADTQGHHTEERTVTRWEQINTSSRVKTILKAESNLSNKLLNPEKLISPDSGIKISTFQKVIIKKQKAVISVLLENIYNPVLFSEQYSELKHMELRHMVNQWLMPSGRKKDQYLICVHNL